MGNRQRGRVNSTAPAVVLDTAHARSVPEITASFVYEDLVSHV